MSRDLTTVAVLLVLIALTGLVGCPQQQPATDAPVIGGTKPPPSADSENPAGAFSSGVSEVDELAPEFTLKDTDGNDVKLSDFSGEILILDFWATWCAPCVKKLKEYEPIIARYANKGVELVAVSLDSKPEVAAGWAKQTKSPYRIAMLDPAFQAAYFPEVTGQVPIPQARIIDRDGNLRYKFSAESTVADLELALSKLAAETVGGDQAVTNEVTAEGNAEAPE